jgi:RNA ligase
METTHKILSKINFDPEQYPDTDAIQLDVCIHPASLIDFDVLYDGLKERVKQRNLKHVVDGDLELFDYTDQCCFDNQWDIFTLMARGLILCPAEKRVVCYPFYKFFNSSEVKIPNRPFTVTEKMDGSMVTIFYHNKWRTATRGAFDSEQALWALAYIHGNKIVEKLDKNTTYIVEAIYSSNKIVVQYDFEDLVLIGAHVDAKDAEIGPIAQKIGIPAAPQHKYDSIDKLLEIAETMSIESEGFVAKFDNGMRVKIKGKEYCRIHKLISYCTPLAIWELMMMQDDLNKIREDLPEEYKNEFDIIRKILEAQFNKLYNEIENFYQDTIDLDDKDIALKFQSQNQYASVPTYLKRTIFACRKHNWLKRVHEKPVGEKIESHPRVKFFRKYMRPTGNILEGYTPSDVIFRLGS